jgi:hypothetical protein
LREREKRLLVWLGRILQLIVGGHLLAAGLGLREILAGRPFESDLAFWHLSRTATTAVTALWFACSVVLIIVIQLMKSGNIKATLAVVAAAWIQLIALVISRLARTPESLKLTWFDYVSVTFLVFLCHLGLSSARQISAANAERTKEPTVEKPT